MPASTSLTQRTRKSLPVWLPPVSNQIRQRRSFTQRSTLKATTLCPSKLLVEFLKRIRQTWWPKFICPLSSLKGLWPERDWRNLRVVQHCQENTQGGLIVCSTCNHWWLPVIGPVVHVGVAQLHRCHLLVTLMYCTFHGLKRQFWSWWTNHRTHHLSVLYPSI